MAAFVVLPGSCSVLRRPCLEESKTELQRPTALNVAQSAPSSDGARLPSFGPRSFTIGQTSKFVFAECLSYRSSFLGSTWLRNPASLPPPRTVLPFPTVSEMFDALAEKFEEAVKSFQGQKSLTKENIQEALREVRVALLDADVNLEVVKKFIADVEEKAEGVTIVPGVTPQQMFIKVVFDELKAVMGDEMTPLTMSETADEPTVIVMAGLQGVGKTTACGKLAKLLQKQGREVLLVATDVYRPAAIDQLITLGESIAVPVFQLGTAVKPVEIARQALVAAKLSGADTVIIDTAGRLTVDREMMKELEEIKRTVKATETLLVVDAMTGQEAALLTRAFNDDVGITGAVLTKFDGDSRGGAALSVRQVAGKPIKFVGVGEGMDDLQPFYPERMASRILGMGDVVTLVEKAQESVRLDDAQAMTQKILDAKFDFDDFLKQMKLIKNMGSLSGVLKMLPGMGKISTEKMMEGERKFRRAETMITAMTEEERKNPDLLYSDASRRQRVAADSGRTDKEVLELITDFRNMKTMMQAMTKRMLGGPDGAQNGAADAAASADAEPSKKKKKQPKRKAAGFGSS